MVTVRRKPRSPFLLLIPLAVMQLVNLAGVAWFGVMVQRKTEPSVFWAGPTPDVQTPAPRVNGACK